MDGYESSKKIREFERLNKLPQVKICAFTADTSESNATKCFEHGMNLFLAKPASSKEVGAILQGLNDSKI